MPLTDVAASALARLRRGGSILWPVEQGQICIRGLYAEVHLQRHGDCKLCCITGWDPTRLIGSCRSAWCTLTKKAGLPGFRFHDLRHCAITQLAEGGASGATIMSLAGHVSKRMLGRYSHVCMEAKRKAMEALAESTKRAGYDTTHDTNVVTLTKKPV